MCDMHNETILTLNLNTNGTIRSTCGKNGMAEETGMTCNSY